MRARLPPPYLGKAGLPVAWPQSKAPGFKTWCSLVGLAQVLIASGPSFPAEAGATWPEGSDSRFRPSGWRQHKDAPVNMVVGTQMLSGELFHAPVAVKLGELGAKLVEIGLVLVEFGTKLLESIACAIAVASTLWPSSAPGLRSWRSGTHALCRAVVLG